MIAVLVMLFDFWKKPQFRICLLMIFGLLMVWVKHPLTNEVTMVDVGQGDSIFLRSMKGDTILIDVGGKVTFGSKEMAGGEPDEQCRENLDSLSTG